MGCIEVLQGTTSRRDKSGPYFSGNKLLFSMQYMFVLDESNARKSHIARHTFGNLLLVM
ncbi:MAG TPA: hypothetical protein VN207_12160 [Ktedonobacteraceae bacterium]|nr:hypothetical protein [Ktedonobacteraceae bacterium]